MMLFEVIHTTRYRYEAPVAQCLNEVRVTPRVLPSQQVRETSLHVEPAPAFVYTRKDYFGNDVSTFGVFENHEKLTATARSLVDVGPSPLVESGTPLSWERVRELLATRDDEACLQASEFVWDSPYVPTLAGLADYAPDIFGENRPLIDVVTELSSRIHTDFKYEPHSTSIDIPLADVLQYRRGVCQDFAHVMIGALRSRSLAARYVSGYSLSGPGVQGAQASHAWISVFFPGTGWLDFDPTNDFRPFESHVTVAWGRDYGDVAPVKGITLGGRGQTVDVEVYVKPV